MFTQKPVCFSKAGWAYVTKRWKLQAKTFALVLSNLQFSFKGFTKERTPQCICIVKVWLCKSISEQSSRRIIDIVALPPYEI